LINHIVRNAKLLHGVSVYVCNFITGKDLCVVAWKLDGEVTVDTISRQISAVAIVILMFCAGAFRTQLVYNYIELETVFVTNVK
jgi:hypothetical protein